MKQPSVMENTLYNMKTALYNSQENGRILNANMERHVGEDCSLRTKCFPL